MCAVGSIYWRAGVPDQCAAREAVGNAAFRRGVLARNAKVGWKERSDQALGI